LTWEDLIIILVAALLGMATNRMEEIPECPHYCATDHMHSFRFSTQGEKWDCQSDYYQDCVEEWELALSP